MVSTGTKPTPRSTCIHDRTADFERGIEHHLDQRAVSSAGAVHPSRQPRPAAWLPGISPLPDASQDVFHVDDGVINHHSDGDGEAPSVIVFRLTPSASSTITAAAATANGRERNESGPKSSRNRKSTTTTRMPPSSREWLMFRNDASMKFAGRNRRGCRRSAPFEYGHQFRQRLFQDGVTSSVFAPYWLVMSKITRAGP